MSETDEKKKAIPELSIESQLLVDKLLTIQVGDVVPYAALSAVISQTVQIGTGQGRLRTARNIMQREHGIVFEAVKGEGLKRMDSAGCVLVGTSYTQRIRRAAKRGLNKLLCANTDELSNAERTDYNATASHLGVLHHLTGRRATKQLTAAAEKTNQRLPIGKTLEAFTENGE